MKKIFLLGITGLFLSIIQADTVIIVPQEQPYYQPYYQPYDYYYPYQPYNGPMRGPNSIEGHKSFREQQRQFQNR